MSGKMSRSLATKFMLACIAASVILVLWSMSGAVSRGRRNEDGRLHAALLGGKPILVPTPSGARRGGFAPSPVPEIRFIMAFEAGGGDLVKVFGLSEPVDPEIEVFDREVFQLLREYVAEEVTAARPGDMDMSFAAGDGHPAAETTVERARIVENADGVLTTATTGTVNVDGAVTNMRSLECLGLLKDRVYRLTATVRTKTGQTPPDLLDELRAWRKALHDANPHLEEPAGSAETAPDTLKRISGEPFRP